MITGGREGRENTGGKEEGARGGRGREEERRERERKGRGGSRWGGRGRGERGRSGRVLVGAGREREGNIGLLREIHCYLCLASPRRRKCARAPPRLYANDEILFMEASFGERLPYDTRADVHALRHPRTHMLLCKSTNVHAP